MTDDGKREMSPHGRNIVLPRHVLHIKLHRLIRPSLIGFTVYTRMKRNTKVSMPVDRSSVTSDNVVGGSRQKKVGCLKPLSNLKTDWALKAKQEISRNSFGKEKSRKSENYYGV